MKIQMNDILLLCVLVMLSLEIAGGAQCQGCHDVGSDNRCKQKPFVCKSSKRRSCYIQRSQKDGKIMKMSRGCKSSCKTGYSFSKGDDIFTWCCSTDNCNHMNAWF